MSLLSFNSVMFESDNKAILRDITVDIVKGDFVSIVGPSGSGKSTFLKLCCNLVSPSSGEISYKGKNYLEYNASDIRKDIAYCFQTPYLFGETVMDNFKFSYHIRDIAMDISRINFLLSKFNLSNEILTQCNQKLSGGEKQRIALIRMILFKPEILLLDEITSALDVENSELVGNNIKLLNEEGTTILWITHNLEQSKKLANKVLTIDSGEIKSLEVLK